MFLRILGLLFALTLIINFESVAQVLKSEFIFQEAPFPSCHASTICATSQGYLVAWFGGTHEKHQDVGIWISRMADDDQWTEPVEVADGIQHADKRYPCWNPVLYRQPSGTISLYYKVGPNPREWWGMLIESTDEGKTWTVPRRLPEDILGPVKNKPLALADGSLIHPSSTEHNGWKIHMEISDINGMNWTRIGPIDGDSIDAIQPTILEHSEGLQILCRSKTNGIVESWSRDGGHSWSELTPTGLPNPNSGIDGVTSNRGRQFLVYNPTSTTEGQWGGERYPLVLAASDDGRMWEVLVTLESEPGEYSYPAIIQGLDGNLHITYTWKRDKIKHVVYRP
ncbi:MAG: exo-alpha-sialidase [Saprospiraceae bacterium]|nr:exo-alpha-sialidase [Saprospiraceae bacterium]